MRVSTELNDVYVIYSHFKLRSYFPGQENYQIEEVNFMTTVKIIESTVGPHNVVVENYCI